MKKILLALFLFTGAIAGAQAIENSGGGGGEDTCSISCTSPAWGGCTMTPLSNGRFKCECRCYKI